jgi:predicted aspartyl protease
VAGYRPDSSLCVFVDAGFSSVLVLTLSIAYRCLCTLIKDPSRLTMIRYTDKHTDTQIHTYIAFIYIYISVLCLPPLRSSAVYLTLLCLVSCACV